MKELTYKQEIKLFSLLTGHKLLEFMKTEAKTVDPKKPITEKGLKKFSG